MEGGEQKWVVSDLIQIKAENEEEVQRRIQAFITTKRSEVDERNIREFINPFSTEPGCGCARTEAVYLHREGEKSHISLKRVENAYGPQTRLADEDCDPRSSSCTRLPVDRQRAEAVEERISNMESHLNMENDGRGIFERLKALEKRISFLEGLSPEYFSNGIPSCKQDSSGKFETSSTEEKGKKSQQAENLSDINNKITQLKQALKRKLEQQTDYPG